MIILVIPLVIWGIMWLFSLSFAGWIVLAMICEFFGFVVAHPPRKKVMCYTEWRKLTPEQRINPTLPRESSTGSVAALIAILAILGAVVVVQMLPNATERSTPTFPLDRTIWATR